MGGGRGAVRGSRGVGRGRAVVARRGGRLHVVRRRLERPRVGRAAQGRAETLPRHFRDTSETVGSWSWETLPATHRQIPPASTASHRRCPTPLASPTAPPTPTARQRRARDTSAGASAITVDEQHGADVNVISWSKQVNYLVVSGADDGSFRVADPPSPRARATRTQPLTHPHHPPFFVARAPRALAVTSGASSSPPLPSGLGPAFDSLGGAGCALHVAPRPNHLRRVVATRVVDYRRRRRGRPGTTDRRLPHRALLHRPPPPPAAAACRPPIVLLSGRLAADQVTLWDLALEDDPEADSAARGRDDLRDLPPQLYFVHQGQRDMKEARWRTHARHLSPSSPCPPQTPYHSRRPTPRGWSRRRRPLLPNRRSPPAAARSTGIRRSRAPLPARLPTPSMSSNRPTLATAKSSGVLSRTLQTGEYIHFLLMTHAFIRIADSAHCGAVCGGGCRSRGHHSRSDARVFSTKTDVSTGGSRLHDSLGPRAPPHGCAPPPRPTPQPPRSDFSHTCLLVFSVMFPTTDQTRPGESWEPLRCQGGVLIACMRRASSNST